MHTPFLAGLGPQHAEHMSRCDGAIDKMDKTKHAKYDNSLSVQLVDNPIFCRRRSKFPIVMCRLILRTLLISRKEKCGVYSRRRSSLLVKKLDLTP